MTRVRNAGWRSGDAHADELAVPHIDDFVSLAGDRVVMGSDEDGSVLCREVA
jgi:hypothetical protein